MTMTFKGFVSVVANGYRCAGNKHPWATDGKLQQDFEGYLVFLEKRRVLYAQWKCESPNALLVGLSDVQRRTEGLRAAHVNDAEARTLLGKMITSIRRVTEVILACNMHLEEGEFKAFKALLRFRSEMALALAIACGRLGISPKGDELAQFIMNTALVRPRA